jgi:predicted nucleic acid-binding protein
MGRIARRVVPSQTLIVIKEDPDDDRILECAAEAESDYIVSADKDLHRLGHYGKARVIKVAALWTSYWGRVGGVEASGECQVALREQFWLGWSFPYAR